MLLRAFLQASSRIRDLLCMTVLPLIFSKFLRTSCKKERGFPILRTKHTKRRNYLGCKFGEEPFPGSLLVKKQEQACLLLRKKTWKNVGQHSMIFLEWLVCSTHSQ